MVNLNSVLNERIARIARKEIRARTGATRKATVRYRGDIAALKRKMASLGKMVAFLEAREKKRASQLPSPSRVEGIRFRSDGLKSHRAKLELSAKEYGRLLGGVSPKTIYLWESGVSRPRRAQVARLAALRGIGKREALRQLALLGGKKPGKNRRRGRYSQTAEEFITALVKGRKATTSAQINAAWSKNNRLGKADNTLSRMVKTRRLRREPVKKGRGSTYWAR
jgi:DNA-binding transcriptional regulator YiaG